MSKEIAQTIGGKKFAGLLAILAAAALIAGIWSSRTASAASATDQGLYATSLTCTPSLVNNVDLTHPPNAASVAAFSTTVWSADTTTAHSTALYVSSRVTPYALVGFLANNNQVTTGIGLVFESPVSSTSSAIQSRRDVGTDWALTGNTNSATSVSAGTWYALTSNTSLSGLTLGADSALEGLTNWPGTPTSPASMKAISGQNSVTQSTGPMLGVMLVALFALLVLTSYTLKWNYAFGTESSTPIAGKGAITERHGSLILSRLTSLLHIGRTDHSG